LVLIIGGAWALIWCAAVIVNARLTQNLARDSFATAASSAAAPDFAAPPIRGMPLADLSIPRLNFSAIVFHGSDGHTLSIGVGHVEDTAFPGEAGNVAIAGHRDTFFRPLRNVHVGDDVFLATPHNRLHYRVSSLGVVGADEISVLQPTENPTLTLITCYPFWVLGHAPDRFVVRATRVEDSGH
jgi:sortase A